MVKKENIFIVLSVLAGIIAVVVFIFPQTWMVAFAKINFSESKAPELYQKPLEKEIVLTNCQPFDCLDFSYFGIGLKTPAWEMEKRQLAKTLFRVVFTNEKSLVLTDNSEMPTFLETLSSGDFSQADIDKIRQFYGEESLGSNYYFFKSILGVSPDDLVLSLSKNEAVAKMSLLFLKKAFLPANKLAGSDFYQFSIGDFKGFQYGAVEDGGQIVVDFFKDGGKGWTLIFSGFSDGEINSTLGSLEVAN